MPLASVAALLLLVFVGVRLISSTMEGASHRQQALPMALLPMALPMALLMAPSPSPLTPAPTSTPTFTPTSITVSLALP